MVNIKSKDNFSWTGKDFKYTQRSDYVPVSKIISDIRKLQSLTTLSTNSFQREDFKELKKDILYLKDEISNNILKREVPSNISKDYDFLMKDVKDRLIEIDRNILG
jgi:hypothetical protein